MTKWKEEFEIQLNKKFTSEETKEIISYYEEIISDRVENGELLENVLSSYPPKIIAKQMIPSVILKRSNDNKTTIKNSYQLLLLVFSAPILIPLALVYLAVIIVFLSLIIAGFSLIFSGLVGFITHNIQVLVEVKHFPTLLGLIGLSFIVFPIIVIIGMWLYKISWIIIKFMIAWISKQVIRKQETL